MFVCACRGSLLGGAEEAGGRLAINLTAPDWIPDPTFIRVDEGWPWNWTIAPCPSAEGGGGGSLTCGAVAWIDELGADLSPSIEVRTAATGKTRVLHPPV